MDKDNKIYETVRRSLLGMQTEEDGRLLDAWLGESDGHRQMYEQLTEARDLTDTYNICKGTDVRKAWKDFEKRTGTSRRVSFRVLRPLLAVAAAAALLLLVINVATERPESVAPELSPELAASITRAEQSHATEATLTIGGASPTLLSSGRSLDALLASSDGTDETEATIVTRHDKEFWLTLPDGTRVHLNYGTSITYPVAFGSGIREVQLDGEAYFIVAHDEQRPFIVHTKDAAVKEYGTEFNVNTRTGHTGVVLVRGSVGITAKGGTEQMMRPGECAEVNGHGVTMSKVDVEPLIAWNTGLFTFDDCTLETLMQVLGRWYGRDIEFADSTLKTVCLTGSLSRYETETATIEAIRQIAGVDISNTGRKIIIGK